MASKSRKLYVAGTAHTSEDVGPIKGEEVKVFNLPSRWAATVDVEGALILAATVEDPGS
jgi:hypothetical protein